MDLQHDGLVETSWLAHNLDAERLRILDVSAKLTSKLENRAEEEIFAEGHIPGAQFFDVASGKGVLSDPAGRYPWTWPPAAQVEEVMGRFGIANGSVVVLYAATPRPGIDFGAMWCTRAWWILHHHGVDCAILNGGLEAWRAEGRPLSKETVSFPPANFSARPAEGVVADRDRVRAAIERNSACIIDALPGASYRGEGEARYGARKGHIQNALNVPYGDLVDPETQRFASLDKAAEVFAAAGIDPAQPAITYCGGGIAATLDAFFLHRLGNRAVSVYDASLMEWAGDAALPMEDPSAGA